MPMAAEVLESRVLLSASSAIVQDASLDPGAINSSYEQIVSADFDGNGSIDFFFWNPTTGENRIVVGEDSSLITNIITPTSINGNDFTTVLTDKLVDEDESTTPGEQLFFWNPVTGKNRLIAVSGLLRIVPIDPNLPTTVTKFFLTPGFADVNDNVVPTNLINGNDFTTVVSGALEDLSVEADLFFWNPATGRNRTIVLDTVNQSPEFRGVRSDVIERSAINGNDFTNVVISNLNGGVSEGLFFWNSVTGKNRAISFNDDSGSLATVFRVETDLIAPGAINGNDFTTIISGDYDGDGDDDLLFWNSTTGRNRLATNTPEAFLSLPRYEVETNCIAPGAINGELDVMINIDTNGIDQVFFWDREAGINRAAVFNT
ncbi:hypothetical protein [Thalassoroseus pseudoceratinae]|uniref:hypothetical protein n=1 Tax=Thalassoroseus pseudoceratinae TaxID=2713176 RepID=UPI00141F0EF0|nr:hypothetical protein [Thalassoroseus pseudoceratinae]